MTLAASVVMSNITTRGHCFLRNSESRAGPPEVGCLLVRAVDLQPRSTAEVYVMPGTFLRLERLSRCKDVSS